MVRRQCGSSHVWTDRGKGRDEAVGDAAATRHPEPKPSWLIHPHAASGRRESPPRWQHSSWQRTVQGEMLAVLLRLTTARISCSETIQRMRCAFSSTRGTGGGSLDTSRHSVRHDFTCQQTSRRILVRSWRWRRSRSAGAVPTGTPPQPLSSCRIQKSRMALPVSIGRCRDTRCLQPPRDVRGVNTSRGALGGQAEHVAQRRPRRVEAAHPMHATSRRRRCRAEIESTHWRRMWAPARNRAQEQLSQGLRAIANVASDLVGHAPARRAHSDPILRPPRLSPVLDWAFSGQAKRINE